MTPPGAAIRAVVFDVGGVLTEPLGETIGRRMVQTGVDLDVIAAVMLPMFASATDGDEPAHRIERGEITIDDFVALMGEHADMVRRVMDPASADFAIALAPHHGMQAFAAELKAAGFVTGVLSNSIREWQPAWDGAITDVARFDVRVFSWEVGLRKPNPAAYHLVCERLGTAPAETLFLDDFEPMVVGARAAGLHAVHVRDHTAAIAEVRALLFPD